MVGYRKIFSNIHLTEELGEQNMLPIFSQPHDFIYKLKQTISRSKIYEPLQDRHLEIFPCMTIEADSQFYF